MTARNSEGKTRFFANMRHDGAVFMAVNRLFKEKVYI